MKRLVCVGLVVMWWISAHPNNVFADVLFESGTLGPTGIFIDQIMGDGVHPGGAVVSPVAFDGVRFQINQPAVTTRIGGHFVGYPNRDPSFFGAIVRLDDATDFPNSGDLSTSDVLGHTLLAFPVPSTEVFGDLTIRLDPGWYSLVVGSGLFGATGSGGGLLNNPDIGSPAYFSHQPGIGWFDISPPFGPFLNYRMVLEGNFVPEPSPISIAATLVAAGFLLRVFGTRRGPT